MAVERKLTESLLSHPRRSRVAPIRLSAKSPAMAAIPGIDGLSRTEVQGRNRGEDNGGRGEAPGGGSGEGDGAVGAGGYAAPAGDEYRATANRLANLRRDGIGCGFGECRDQRCKENGAGRCPPVEEAALQETEQRVRSQN